MKNNSDIKPITDEQLAKLDKMVKAFNGEFFVRTKEYLAIRERLRLADAVISAAELAVREERRIDLIDLARAVTAYRRDI